ncbi:Photosystem I assembly protein Ycf4 [Apostasia shenzhenica]|uniref:Photosystem I assembly protein Ycf4 n=1 Tax=Apostasia shenzhenica TaxID=1088818 RepID=A0A2I0A2V9_9ASPA|nr:Photosystem I assembly protein Ycf4 [Apostasia shenzhenica]
MCLFRWGFPGRNRRIFLRFFLKDIQSIRMEVRITYTTRTLYLSQYLQYSSKDLDRFVESIIAASAQNKCSNVCSST